MSHDHLSSAISVLMSEDGVAAIASTPVGVRWSVKGAPTREDVRHPQPHLHSNPSGRKKSVRTHCTTDHPTLKAAHSDTPQKPTP